MVGRGGGVWAAERLESARAIKMAPPMSQENPRPSIFIPYDTMTSCLVEVALGFGKGRRH